MIEVKNLSFRYKNGNILNNVSFTAKSGKITAVIGVNETGKSTLLKNIGGTLKGKGDIFINNKSIDSYDKCELSKMISYLSQSSTCKSILNVFEVVLAGRTDNLSFRVSDKDIEKVNNIMKMLNIEEFKSRHMGKLSKGQRQLVFIAKALSKEGKVLILDEPTNFLDLSHKFEILNILKELTINNNLTTIITLHDLYLAARFADEIIVLDKGRIYNMGEAKKVLTEKMMKEIYGVKAHVYTDNEGLLHILPIESIDIENKDNVIKLNQQIIV